MKTGDSEIADKIVKTVFYIDRLVLWFIKKPKGLAELLEGHCGKINTPPISDTDRAKHKKSENFKFLSNCYYSLDISQPSPRALKMLAEFTKPGRDVEIGHVITHFEPVMDCVTKTEADADEVGRYMQQRLVHNLLKGEVKKRHDKKEVITYWNDTESDITLVLYSDLPSKVAKKPCAHIEYRFGSADTVNTLGSKFYWVHEICKFDKKTFWKENLKLVDPKSGDEIENSQFFKTNRVSLA